MKKKFILASAIFISAALVAGYVASKWSSYHNFEGKCLHCHLDAPKEGEEPDIFVRDLNKMCSECHEDSLRLSHPVDMRPNMQIPPDMPLDWRGALTCLTCHFAHQEGYGNTHIRVKKTGQGLCVQCHGEVDASLHSASIGTAHLASSVNQGFDIGDLSDTLDQLSIKCLSCHDALLSFDAPFSSPANPPGFYHGGSSMNLSHPVGVSYAAAKEKYRGSLRDADKLPPQIKLFEGKIGCASCHDPYSVKHSRLVMSNRGSALCLACHRK